MFIKIYFTALSAFLILDALWLGFIAKSFYAKQIGFLFKSDINWIAALLFYALFIVALILFVIHPAIEKNSIIHALLFGALFGFITYATYDLTNLATLKGWPVMVTIVDLIWGSFVTAAVSSVTFLIFTRF
ncbi:DUF2177 family protein [Candidatus Parcubacteria bacterium]|nr:DUF2177 family protein [Candidatus Parcubacteria bacterium]